jgi:hypothetical protein
MNREDREDRESGRQHYTENKRRYNKTTKDQVVLDI